MGYAERTNDWFADWESRKLATFHVDDEKRPWVTLPWDSNKEVVFFCIGTDRSTGDSLGPLVGTFLKRRGVPNVYGTLDDPVHATNLADVHAEVKLRHPDAMVLAVDACLGHSKNIGKISLHGGAMRPGVGAGKNLIEVGNASITGVVNVGGFMEYFVLQNTRLALIMKMAERITDFALTLTAGSRVFDPGYEEIMARIVFGGERALA